jgi:hypothetical protein
MGGRGCYHVSGERKKVVAIGALVPNTCGIERLYGKGKEKLVT